MGVNSDTNKEKECEEIITEGAFLSELRNEVGDLKQSGNDCFKNEDYHGAINYYDRALDICNKDLESEKSILFSNISLAYFKLEQSNDAIFFCTKSLEIDEKFTKPRIRRAILYENLEKYEEAIEDYNYLIGMNYDVLNLKNKINNLRVKLDERNEKLKTEMFSKLKDLGNMVLKPFGLSTDNFKVNKDPSGGDGYNISFQK